MHLSPVNIQSFCDNLPSNYHYKNKSELKWVISKTKQIGLSSHIIIIPFLGFDYVNIENKGSEFHKTPGKCKGKCKCVRHIVFTENIQIKSTFWNITVPLSITDYFNYLQSITWSVLLLDWLLLLLQFQNRQILLIKTLSWRTKMVKKSGK